MKLYAVACEYCLGHLIAGERGQGMHTQALRWMRSEQIVNPHALVRMLMPGILQPATGS
jgi:hypothetical protein